MGLNEKLKEVSDILRGTPEYSELKQAKVKIDSNTELKNKIEDFKRKQQELFSSSATPRELEAKAAELNRQLTNLSQIPEIDKFIKAEKAFAASLQRAFKTINDHLESGLR